MRTSTFTRLLAPALVILTLLPCVVAAQGQLNYAYHTPGFRAYQDATRFMNNGSYFSARHRYKQAAFWADKMAQYNVGVIYYHGHGVEADLSRAWAWLALSAERGYPNMVEMARLVSEEMTPAQRERGKHILEGELRPEYGDAVAVERTARRMAQEARRPTGSRTGFTGALKVIDYTGRQHDGHQFYHPDLTNFHRVIERETELFNALARANIYLGDFEVIETDAD